MQDSSPSIPASDRPSPVAGRTWVRPLATIASLLFLVLVGRQLLVRQGSDLSAFLELDPVDIAGLLVGMVLFFVVLGSIFAQLAAAIGARLAFVEWYTLTLAGNFASYLLPTRPGIALKAAYLKTVHGVSLSRYSAVFATHSFLLLFTSGCLALGLLAVRYATDGFSSPLLVAVCAGMLGLAVLPGAVLVHGGVRLPLPRRIADRLDDAVVGFRTIWSRPGVLVGVTAAIVAQYLIAAVLFTLAFRALGLDVPYSTVLLVGVFSTVSNLASITPGNLGVLELIVASLYAAVGYDFTSGLLAATLVRAAQIAVVGIGTPLMTTLLVGRHGVSWRQLWPRARSGSGSGDPGERAALEEVDHPGGHVDSLGQ